MRAAALLGQLSIGALPAAPAIDGTAPVAAAPVMVTHQGYTLGFRLQNTDAAQAALPPVSQPSSMTEPAAQTAAKPASAEAVELQRQTAMTVTGKEAAVSYEEAMPSVDVQYALSGQRLKESLVFDSQPARSSFTFVLNHPGLVPVLQDSGAVHFYAEQEEEPVFILTAPYMFDAADEMCMDVAVSLVPAGNGSLYTLTPDGGWLADPSRVYPVTLDPTVTTSTSASAIEDAGVNESNPTTNYYDVDRIYVGSNWTGSVAQESRMYVRLPRCTSIGTSDFILKATLYLQHYPVVSWQTASNKVFDLYDAGSNNWDSASITWNSQKSYTFGSLIASFTSDKSRTSPRWRDSGIKPPAPTTASSSSPAPRIPPKPTAPATSAAIPARPTRPAAPRPPSSIMLAPPIPALSAASSAPCKISTAANICIAPAASAPFPLKKPSTALPASNGGCITWAAASIASAPKTTPPSASPSLTTRMPRIRAWSCPITTAARGSSSGFIPMTPITAATA